ncbi:MAG TPA: hypothetical protein VG758_29915 [Hyphomicrobiaceae bacterium]|jgi:hypothetical protein|nr:hypothetical protein [Hyphomicrobiaceae bacterium]
MVTFVPDLILNVLLWTAVVCTLVLTTDRFVPILNGTAVLIGFATVLVLSLLWPRKW